MARSDLYIPAAPPNANRRPVGAVNPGNPLSPTIPSAEITYGFGNDQFLTDSQQRIADSVRHAFEVSLAQRDRDLQRYQMPQLASNIEDEALARAIATANIANAPKNPYGITFPRATGGGRGGGGGGGGGSRGGGFNPYNFNPYMRAPTTPDAGTSWRSLLSGASSLLPLIFGKDAWGNFMNKGIVGLFRDGAGNLVPVNSSGLPVTNTPLTNYDAYGMGGTPTPDYTSGYGSWDMAPAVDYTSGYGSWDMAPPMDVITTPYVDYGANMDWGGGGGWSDFGGWGDWSGL